MAYSDSQAGKQWGAYLLRCADGSLYAGASNDMSQRLRRHQAGTASRYTRSRLPVELVYWEACADRSAALKREAAIKKLPRDKKWALLAAPTTEPSSAGEDQLTKEE
jgi:putative endonuclease